jgi:arylsulfatase A
MFQLSLIVELMLAFTICVETGGSALADTAGTANGAVRPNFIFILVDDWGWTDAGCCGSDLYETPNIDRLAAQATRFTNAYAACTVCSPTRAAVMTGMYPGRTNVTDWIPGHYPAPGSKKRAEYPLMPPDWTQRLEHRHVTIAEALKTAGYRTAHVGKWAPHTQFAGSGRGCRLLSRPTRF